MKEQVNKVLQNYRMKRFLEHLVGPIGSVIFHVLIVVLAVKFMIFDKAEKPAEIEVMVMEADTKDLEEFQKELEKIEELQELNDEMLAPDDMPMDMEAPPTDTPPAEDVTTDLSALNMTDVSSPLVMKGLYAGRSAGGRATALGQYGGKWGEFTEAAVLKALEWLKNNQAPDGSWGPNKAAMTGLALLTFLAHGETTSSEKYGPVVEKAIKFLISQQNERGEFLNTNSQPGPYAHGIAAYAISEAYGLTRIPSVKVAMEKAINVILDGQQPGGGWDYNYRNTGRRDTSVAGWQIQALKSAYIAGSDNPRIKDALERAAQDIKSAQDPESGRFYYTDKGSHKTDSITAIGVLSLQLIGHAKDKEAQRGLDAMNGADCDWNKPPAWALYAWYYVTQAKFHNGGPVWSAWNAKFARELAKNQNADGSWTAPGGKANLDHGAEVGDGPVYATTFAALTLQVYYRFLPTYKPIAVEKPTGEKQDDDVSIEII